MSEHRDARREVGKLSPAPVQAPRAGGISDKNTRDENRRLKEKNEHGMHLVISPRLLIAPIGAASHLQCRELTLSRLAMGPQANRANPRSEIMRDSRPLKSRNTTGHRNSTDIPSLMAGASGIRRLIVPWTSSFSGAEERKPDDTQDQDRKAGGDRQEREHRWSGFGLPRLGRRLNDLTFLLRRHGSLNLHRSLRRVRATPNFRSCSGVGPPRAGRPKCDHLPPPHGLAQPATTGN